MAFVADQAYQEALAAFASPVAEQAQGKVNAAATTAGNYVGLSGDQTNQIVSSIAQGAANYQRAEDSGDPFAKSDAIAGAVIGVLAVLAPYGTVAAAVLAGLYALGRAIGVSVPKNYVGICQQQIMATEAHILSTVWKVLQASATQYQLDWMVLLSATNEFLIKNNSPYLIELRPAYQGELDLDPNYQGAGRTPCEGSASYLGYPVWRNSEGVPVMFRLLMNQKVPPFNAQPAFRDMGPEWFSKIEEAQKKTRELLGAGLVEAVRNTLEKRDTQRLFTDGAIRRRIAEAARNLTKAGSSYSTSVSTDIAAYEIYRRNGGTLGYGHWATAGKPTSPNIVYKPSYAHASDVVRDAAEFKAYQDEGGSLNYGEWAAADKPAAPVASRGGGGGGGSMALLLLPLGLLGALALGSRK